MCELPCAGVNKSQLSILYTDGCNTKVIQLILILNFNNIFTETLMCGSCSFLTEIHWCDLFYVYCGAYNIL